MIIKEYKTSEGYIRTETKVNEYTFRLTNWFWLDLQQEGYEGVYYHTIASEDALKYFSTPSKWLSCQDFGDCFIIYKNDILKFYSKPNFYENKYDENNCDILFKMHKDMFPTLVEFLKQEQVNLTSPSDEKMIEKRYKERIPILKNKTRNIKLKRILK